MISSFTSRAPPGPNDFKQKKRKKANLKTFGITTMPILDLIQIFNYKKVITFPKTNYFFSHYQNRLHRLQIDFLNSLGLICMA